MSTEEVIRMYDEAHEIGFRGIFFWGGEPLLRDDFPDLVKHVKNKGWYVSMATNGTLLSNKADQLAPYVDSMLVSIDHPRKHDEIRGVEGTFENCISGARKVKAINPKLTLVFSCVLTKHNHTVIEELVTLANKENGIFLLQNMDRGDTQTGLSNITHDVTAEQRDNVMALMQRMKKQGCAILNSNSYFKQFTTPETPFECKCQRLYLTIDAIGNIIDCTVEKPLINVKAGLKQALDSPEYHDFLCRSDKCGLCRDAGTLETTYFYNFKPEPYLNLIRNAMR